MRIAWRLFVCTSMGKALQVCITKMMKCSRATIHKAKGSVTDGKRTRRPRKTSKKDNHLLKVLSVRNRRATSKQLVNEFKQSTEKDISPRTVRRRLLEVGLKVFRAKKKSLLTKASRKKRVSWAKDHLSFDWDHVVFSDESRFNSINDRLVLVRRRKGEEYKPECLAPQVKHGGGGVMVWGCFSANGIGKLHKVKETVDSEHYIKILKFCAVPSMKHLFPNIQSILQQDNAPCHTSMKVKKWFGETS